MSTRDNEDDSVSAVTGSRADHLIDRLAREMTHGDPSPRLLGSVRARIARGRRWPFRSFGSRGAVPLWVRAASMAAAVLVVGVAAGLMVWTARPAPLVLRQVTHVPLPAPEVTRSADTLSLAVPSFRPERSAVRRARAPVRFEPLVIEPLEVRQIAVETSSGMMPIEIMELQIEPLRIE